MKKLGILGALIVSLFLGYDEAIDYIQKLAPEVIEEYVETYNTTKDEENIVIVPSYDIDQIPEYSGDLYVVINDNVPTFEEEDKLKEAFEIYSQLDQLDRVGVAYAKLGIELMPTEDRESISNVYPSGWISTYYENVDGKYLYNRSHMIGFQLAGENANKLNLMTGTRTFNVKGMLPFENMVADYIKETSNHVMYRITPIFEDDNLVAKGIIMEAFSIEDDGEGIMFNVFVYNNEPNIEINYLTGESKAIEVDEEQ